MVASPPDRATNDSWFSVSSKLSPFSKGPDTFPPNHGEAPPMNSQIDGWDTHIQDMYARDLVWIPYLRK